MSDTPARHDLRLIIDDQSKWDSRSTSKVPGRLALASSEQQVEAEQPGAALAVGSNLTSAPLPLATVFPSFLAEGPRGLNLPSKTQLWMAFLLRSHPWQLAVAPHRHSSWGCNRFLSSRMTIRCSAIWSLRWMDVACRGCWTSEKQAVLNQTEWITPSSCQPVPSLADCCLRFSLLALWSDLLAMLHSDCSDPCWIPLYQRLDELGSPCSPIALSHPLSWFLEASSGRTWFTTRQPQSPDVMQTNMKDMPDQISAPWDNSHSAPCCCSRGFYCRSVSAYVSSPQLDDHGFERTWFGVYTLYSRRVLWCDLVVFIPWL